MKKFKKILALALSLAMVLGMSVTSFAAGNPKITVSGVPEGAIVTYKQIATAAPTDPLGWELVSGVTLGGNVTLNQLAGKAVAGEDVVAETDRGNGNAAAGTINSNSMVATAIQNITLNGESSKLSLSSPAVDGKVTATISDVTPGLYVIEVKKAGYTFSRMMAYVAYNDDKTAAVSETTVTAKGRENQVKKEITKVTATDQDGDIATSVAENDEIEFKITDSYPYLDQTIVNPKFEITDIVTGGKIMDGTVKVSFNGTEETTDANYKLEINDGNGGFKITFGKKDAETPYTYDIAQAGKEVTITYKVKVDAGDASLDNTVMSSISKYPNKPGEPENPDPDTYAEVIIPKFSAPVYKTDDSTPKNPLGEAVFTLYIETTEADATHAVVAVSTTEGVTAGTIKEMKDVTSAEKSADTTKYLKAVTTGTASDKVTVTTSSETTSDKTKGMGTFTGLDAQKPYWVAETTAPAGYSLSTVATKLTGATFASDSGTISEVTKSIILPDGTTKSNVKVKVTEYKVGTNFTQVDVTDTKLSALPSTGGIGTTIFTIGGCAIMIVAAGLFFATRRKAEK